jgi:hypothetical protein
MRERLKVISTYIFRGWEDEPTLLNPLIKIIPPLFEMVSYLIGIIMILKLSPYFYFVIYYITIISVFVMCVQ